MLAAVQAQGTAGGCAFLHVGCGWIHFQFCDLPRDCLDVLEIGSSHDLTPALGPLHPFGAVGCLQPPAEGEVPGWHEAKTVTDPAGHLWLERVEGLHLEGRLQLGAPSPAPFFVLAMRWEGVEVPQVLARINAIDGERFAVDLDPPPGATLGVEPLAGDLFPIFEAACPSQRTKGVLLIYAADAGQDPAVLPNAAALVGMSSLWDPRFRFRRQSGFALALPACKGFLPDLRVAIESERWLGLSLCANESSPGCAVEARPSVRLASIEAEVTDTQVTVQFTPLLPAGESHTVEVNGLPIEEEFGRFVLPRGISTQTVKVKLGARTPWIGRLQLPPRDVGLTLNPTTLAKGEPFELTWKNDDWATEREVLISPARLLKVGSLRVDAAPGTARGTYEGWKRPDDSEPIDRVSVGLRLRRDDKGCVLTKLSSLEAPVAQK